jgi:cytochrome d ubiquinol oxidase subunit II
MSGDMLAYASAVLIWISLITYAVLGGADFGGGIWDLFSLGPAQDEKRRLISNALGPVWEANNVWLIYLVVGLMTAFPVVAATLATSLFIPFSLALIGVVMRGAAFAFRSHLTRFVAVSAVWGRAFGIASLLTPFFLGTCAAAVASGQIQVVNGNAPVALFRAWLTPFALVIGLLGLAICATIAPVYLTVEAQRINNESLTSTFRIRGLLANGAVAVLGLLGLCLTAREAPQIWRGMFDHALWAVGVTALLWLATSMMLWLRRYRLARACVVLEASALLGTWGLAQLPYIIPPDLTIPAAASPPMTLWAFLVSALVGMLVLIPSIWFLFHVFKAQTIMPTVHEKEFEEA